MAIAAVFEVDGMTQGDYDTIMRELDAKGLGAPAGRLSHVAGPRPGGWLVVDTWESADLFQSFGAQLMPLIGRLGLRAEPAVTPIQASIGAGDASTSTVARMFDALATGDATGIAQVASPALVHEEVGQRHEGVAAVAAHFKVLATAFPDARIVVDRQVVAGNTVVSEMRFTGTHTGPLATPQGEVPPTGRRIDVPGCVLHTVEGGVVTVHRGYYDQMAMLAQLGLMPTPVSA